MKSCQILDNNIQEKENNTKDINIFINQWSVSNHLSFFIPYEINKNKFKLRKEYIDYISKLGKVKILGKNIRDFFTINEISYYTLSRINEKNIFDQDSHILQSVKFLSIKKILNEKKIKKITYDSSDKNLEKVLALYCSQKNIFFTSRVKNLNINFTYKLKKTILFFLYFCQIKFYIKKNSATKNPSIFFFSYFLKFNKLKKNYPSQNYWGNLFAITRKKKIKIGINYIFNKSKEYDLKKSEEFLIGKSSNLINNKILNDRISIQNFFKLIFYYSILFVKSFLIRKKIFQQNDINLYYYLKDDLHSSLRGTLCLKNLFFNFCIKEFFSNKKKIKIGFYLFENLFWEKLINFYWKKNKHGKLIAVIHSSIGFWDLRYHLNDHKKYLPNLILSNSKYNKKIFIDINLKKRLPKILQVNTLNYAKNIKKTKYTNKKYKILIVGDIKPGNTKKLLDIIFSVTRGDSKFKLFFKPHPANLSNIQKTKERNITITNNLNFEKYEIAVLTTTTSAYIEALATRIKTLIYLDPENFNSVVSPQVGGHAYFYDKNSLRQALYKKRRFVNFNYYNSGNKFLQWHQILDKIKNNNFNFVK